MDAISSCSGQVIPSENDFLSMPQWLDLAINQESIGCQLHSKERSNYLFTKRGGGGGKEEGYLKKGFTVDAALDECIAILPVPFLLQPLNDLIDSPIYKKEINIGLYVNKIF